MNYLIKISLFSLLLVGCATDQRANNKDFNPTLSCKYMDKEVYNDYEESVKDCIDINYYKFVIMQVYLMKRGRYKDELFTFWFCVNKDGHAESIKTKKGSNSPNLETYMHMYLLKMRFPKPTNRMCFSLPFEFREKPRKKEGAGPLINL